MVQKYLHTILPYDYKFEMYGNAHNGTTGSAGILKITDASGKVVYSGATGGRGHTLFVFNLDMSLIEKITYDSYGQNNTTTITEKLKEYASGGVSKFMFILSSDAITNDSDFELALKSIDNDFNVNIQCTQSRRGFVAIILYNGNVTSYPFVKVAMSRNLQSSINLTEYAMHINRALGMSRKAFSFCNSSNVYTRIYPASDTTSAIGKPVLTLKYASTTAKSISIKSGYTYTVKVRFRGRGDGTPTSDKCSSLGFIAWNSGWVNSFGYIHYSATAYKEMGQIVEWTFTFKPTHDYNMFWALFGIINNAFANGDDKQTIDVYYYDFYYTDIDGNTTRVECKGNDDSINVNSTFPAIPSQKFLKITHSDGSIFYTRIRDNHTKIYSYASSVGLPDTLEKLTYLEMENLDYSYYDKRDNKYHASQDKLCNFAY